MRSLRYLNTVLTVIAVLLALHLWTLWIGGPSAVATAAAPGLGNAATQRRQMVDQLKRLTVKIEELTSLFRSGQARVKVDAPKNAQRAPRP